jgi:hypothetical protein
MNKSLIAVLICISFCTLAKDPNRRGLFVDGFIIYYANHTVDSANSILGNTSREDSLLNYCKHNHVEYICLYNLYPAIAGSTTQYNTTYRGYLSCFIENAKTNYCILQVGAAGETPQFFDDVDSNYTLIVSPPEEIGDQFRNSEFYYSGLDIVENEYSADDPIALKAEMMKYYIRIQKYNLDVASGAIGEGDCHGDIDVLTLEQEFWNLPIGGTATDHSWNFDTVHVDILNAMASMRDFNNADTSNNPLMTEDYIGKFHNDTIADSLQIDTLDDLVDRILLTFYIGWTSGASYDYPTEFFTTNQPWQEDRLVQFGQNQKQTIIWPLFECGWQPNRRFLGNWLTDSLSQGNSYLKAEGIWRNLHRDSLLYGNNHDDHYGIVSLNQNDSIQGYMWFKYRDSPFPQWVFDDCRDPNERLSKPQSFQNITTFNNEVGILMPEDFSEMDYLARCYTVDGRLLSSQKIRLLPGLNLIHVTPYNRLSILTFLSTDGKDSRTLVLPIRH